jgi:hypothetical protein
MRNLLGLAIFLLTTSTATAAETVTGSELKEDHNGYPCFTTLHTDAEKKITLQLSDYKDVWSLNFFVSDRAFIYRQFFDNQGLRGDNDAFAEAFDSVRIGERTITLNDAHFYVIRLQDLDESSGSSHSIVLRHNVVMALQAMTGEGIEIEGLVSLDGTVDALREFRSCSYDAMGLQEGKLVKKDARAEYRMIFEGAFDNWLTKMAHAEGCLVTRFDDDAVSEVIKTAANAFHPGMMNLFKRREYREGLEGRLSMAKLRGSIDALGKGCLMVSTLANMSRMPVDMAIEAAAMLDD